MGRARSGVWNLKQADMSIHEATCSGLKSLPCHKYHQPFEPRRLLNPCQPQFEQMGANKELCFRREISEAVPLSA